MKLKLTTVFLSLFLFAFISYKAQDQPQFFSPFVVDSYYAGNGIYGFANISYSTTEKKMAIYIPTKNFKNSLVVLVPGGGFLDVGYKVWIEKALRYAADGHAVALIDYTTIGKDNPMYVTGVYEEGITTLNHKIWYAASQDVNAALKYLSSIRNKIGFDKDKIFVKGQSAGGIASLNALFFDNFRSDYKEILRQEGDLNASTLPSAINSNYSVAGFMGEAAGVTDDSFFEGNNGPDFPMNLTHANGDKGVNFNKATIENGSAVNGSKWIRNKIICENLDNKVILNIILSDYHDFLGENGNVDTKTIEAREIMLDLSNLRFINLVLNNKINSNLNFICSPDFNCIPLKGDIDIPCNDILKKNIETEE